MRKEIDYRRIKSEFYLRMEVLMKRNWILKADELPSAYEEVEILMVDGNIHKDMIVRGKYGNLEWRNFEDRSVKAWRYIE